MNWTVLKDYSETNSVTWSPIKPDQYLLVVHVKDSSSSKSYDTYTSRSVTVKKTQQLNLLLLAAVPASIMERVIQ